jgi:hypothetical protein
VSDAALAEVFVEPPGAVAAADERRHTIGSWAAMWSTLSYLS